jgi:hypothetical protein
MAMALETNLSPVNLVSAALKKLTILQDSLLETSSSFQYDLQIMLGYESRRLRGWAEALGLGQEDVLLQLLDQFTTLVAQLEQLQRYLNHAFRTKNTPTAYRTRLISNKVIFSSKIQWIT